VHSAAAKKRQDGCLDVYALRVDAALGQFGSQMIDELLITRF